MHNVDTTKTQKTRIKLIDSHLGICVHIPIVPCSKHSARTCVHADAVLNADHRAFEENLFLTRWSYAAYRLISKGF